MKKEEKFPFFLFFYFLPFSGRDEREKERSEIFLPSFSPLPFYLSTGEERGKREGRTIIFLFSFS